MEHVGTVRSALVKIRGHRLKVGNECIHGKVLITYICVYGKVLISDAEWGQDEKMPKITGSHKYLYLFLQRCNFVLAQAVLVGSTSDILKA